MRQQHSADGAPSEGKTTSTPKDDNDSQPKVTPREKSEISEDIPDELLSGYTETVSDLRLRLDETEEEKDAKAVTPRTEIRAPESARTLSEIPEEYSVRTAISDAEDVGQTPRSPTDKAPRSARTETIGSEFTDDFESERSEASHSEKTYTYSSTYSSSTQSRSKESVESSLSRSDRSTTETKPSDKSEPRLEAKGGNGRVESSIQESVHTEEDISEHFDEASDLEVDADGDSAMGLTFDLKQDLPEVAPPAGDETLQEKVEDLMSDFDVGDRVCVGGVQAGTLMFKGPTKFVPGFWGGVALDKPEGRNDGSKDGVQYFKCKPNHGIFAPPDKLAHLKEEDAKEPVSSSASSSSEHTLTEDVTEGRHKDRSEADQDEEDLDLISEPKPDSITEDISVATDSELERVISSAAAAVEGFGDQRPQSPTDATSEDVTSQEVTPRQPDDLQGDLGVSNKTRQQLSYEKGKLWQIIMLEKKVADELLLN